LPSSLFAGYPWSTVYMWTSAGSEDLVVVGFATECKIRVLTGLR
jgi:hypothetical protein